jgi:hypothetical protein
LQLGAAQSCSSSAKSGTPITSRKMPGKQQAAGSLLAACLASMLRRIVGFSTRLLTTTGWQVACEGWQCSTRDHFHTCCVIHFLASYP